MVIDDMRRVRQEIPEPGADGAPGIETPRLLVCRRIRIKGQPDFQCVENEVLVAYPHPDAKTGIDITANDGFHVLH